MTAFARPSLLDSRYAAIAETSAYTYDDDDLVNYAEFLRKHSRYVTKGGYVDSSRRIRSLQRQQDNIPQTGYLKSPSRPGLLATLNKSTLSAPAGGTTSRKAKSSDEDEQTSSTSINLENKKKEYEKHMKTIEEEMVKAKQDEREAKRLEGDIKKEQRYLHNALRELDVDATRKRYNAEKHLSKNLEEKDKIEREYVKKREKQTKQRTDRLMDTLQTNKDKDRRNILLCNDLTRQYKTKSNELNIKHLQLHRIHTDFEQKIQQNELEESRLRKELTNIAMALNLEAQKVKSDMKDFLNIADYDEAQASKQNLEQEQKPNQTRAYGKSYDLGRRRLSDDMIVHRSTFDLKQHEALRRIGETKSRLETIYAKQRQLNASRAIIEQDRRATIMMSKMADIENRRSQLASRVIDKPDKSQNQDSEAKMKAKAHHIELDAKKHEDRLRDLENKMSTNEELEYELRKSVKDAEFRRRKKEQEVQRLKEDLIRKKREDAKRIQDAIARSEKEEKDLQIHLEKEKAKLNKLQTRRERNRQRLSNQGHHMRENKALLEMHQREHERLLRIQTESQSMQSLHTI